MLNKEECVEKEQCEINGLINEPESILAFAAKGADKMTQEEKDILVSNFNKLN